MTRWTGSRVEEDYESSEPQGPPGCKCYVAAAVRESDWQKTVLLPVRIAASRDTSRSRRPLREPPAEVAEGSGCFGSARQLAQTGGGRG